MRSKSLFELAAVPPLHSESLFEPAVQDHYSKVLVSVALCSESLYSALLCYEHGYARVHTSIYTEVLVQRGVLGPSTCLRRALAIAVRRCRQGAQNGRLGLPRCRQGARNGCSGMLWSHLSVRNGCSSMLWSDLSARSGCSKSLFERTDLCYTVLCIPPALLTLLRAWICTGSH